MSVRSRWPVPFALLLALAGGLAFSQETPPAKAQGAKPDAKKPKHTNRLAKEASPYLRQHAHNPVDWYPWGEEAFAKAKTENKLVFLSIGYATCHWCHVMERESFENEAVAKYLNQHFVSIKVDREERPDIDEIYMTAIQVATGSGGWPLSVFLAPDGKPLPVLPAFRRQWGSALTGGTYFPQPARFGRKSFMAELEVRVDIWAKYRDRLLKDSTAFTEVIKKAVAEQKQAKRFEPAQVLLKGKQGLQEAFDKSAGGFPGDARRNPTRFPMPHLSSFLLRYHQRHDEPQSLYMVKKTLTSIRRGGLRDHLAGGFHRYSVDAQWEIPHFEKMLYDQAGLVRAFVEAWQVTRDAKYAAVARETMEFVLRSMRDPKGGFTSAWDADSEGVEGKYYVWTQAEVKALLGADGALFGERYSVTETGNFHEHGTKNHTHLQLKASIGDLATKHKLTTDQVEARLARARATLLAARNKRVPPLHDDKLLVDWNGMMIGSAALAGRVLGEPRYTKAAEEAATFILTTLRTKEGKLLHRYRAGQAGIPGMLEDYAFFAWGLVELYETTFDLRWLTAAKELCATMVADFWDAKAGGFFQVDAKSKLLTRPKPTYDGAIPAGNSVAALVLVQLGTLLGDTKLTTRAAETLRWYSKLLVHSGGRAAAVGLQALDALLGPRREVVIAGDPKAPQTQAMLKALRSRFLPRTVVILRPPGEAKALTALIPFIKGQVALGGKPTAYVCEDYTCKAPVSSVAALVKLVEARPELKPRDKGKRDPLLKPGDPGNKQR